MVAELDRVNREKVLQNDQLSQVDREVSQYQRAIETENRDDGF